MKIMNNYTFEEVIALTNVIDSKDVDKVVTLLRRLYSGELTQPFAFTLSLHQIDYDDLLAQRQNPDAGYLEVNPTPYSKLINLIKLRYGDNYLPSVEEELTSSSINPDTKPLNAWAKKFMGILFSTKDKYINILNVYNDNLSKLMDGLKGKTDVEHENHRDEDYDTDVTGKNLLNDTPTTTDVVSDIEQNQFVSELSKSTAHTDNVGDIDEEGESHTTSENDTKYVMEKIKDIQDNFQKVLYEWSNEFAPLFIEEV